VRGTVNITSGYLMLKTVRVAVNINYLLTAPLTVVSLRCPSVVYVNCPLIVLNISCPSVNYVNNT
jgi:hypothetical protein